MNIEVITDLSGIDGVREQWDELAAADPRDGFFRLSGWYVTWMRRVRPEATPLIVAMRDAAGALVGLAPLCRQRFDAMGVALQGVGFGGRELVSGDFLDVLARPADRTAVHSTLLDWLSRESEWNLLVLGELVEGSDLHRAARAWAQARGFAVRQQEERICPYVELPASFDAYLAGLGGSHRYHVRRRTREIVDKHGGRIIVCTEPHELTARLDTLVRLHLARWHHANLLGTLGNQGLREFLADICTAAPAGGCRLYLLEDDREVVAALLTFRFRHSALYYQAGWDPSSRLHRFSPGVVLMARSIADAIDDRLRYYEFLQGDERYKAHWTRTYRRTVTLVVARSLAARGCVRAAGVTDRLKRWVRRPQATAASWALGS